MEDLCFTVQVRGGPLDGGPLDDEFSAAIARDPDLELDMGGGHATLPPGGSELPEADTWYVRVRNVDTPEDARVKVEAAITDLVQQRFVGDALPAD